MPILGYIVYSKFISMNYIFRAFLNWFLSLHSNHMLKIDQQQLIESNSIQISLKA